MSEPPAPWPGSGVGLSTLDLLELELGWGGPQPTETPPHIFPTFDASLAQHNFHVFSPLFTALLTWFTSYAAYTAYQITFELVSLGCGVRLVTCFGVMGGRCVLKGGGGFQIIGWGIISSPKMMIVLGVEYPISHIPPHPPHPQSTPC